MITRKRSASGESSWVMNSRARTAVTLTRVQAFEQLRGNLELTGLQEAKVARRQQNVRDAVASQLTVVR